MKINSWGGGGGSEHADLKLVLVVHWVVKSRYVAAAVQEHKFWLILSSGMKQWKVLLPNFVIFRGIQLHSEVKPRLV
jgi:hypothetical protein